MARERERPGAPLFIDPPGYERHRPEATLLEFEAYLKCGRLEHGFLRVRCEDCHAEKLVAFSCKRRGFCPSCGARVGAVAAVRAAVVLGIVYRTLSAHILIKRGSRARAGRRAP